MSFSFGAPKTASGFTLTTSTAPATTASGLQFNFSGAGGDTSTTQVKPLGLFGSTLSTTSTATTPAASTFNFGGTAGTTTAASFNLSTTTATTSVPSFGFSALTSTTTSSTTALATGFSLGGTTTSLGIAPTVTTSIAPTLSFGAALAPTTSLAAPTFPLGGLSTTAALTTALAPTSALPATGTLTFAQLEDAINKWTVELEEQGKVFENQSKHLNAWDRLLIANGDKITSVSNGMEKVKQQQQQLDQELDFILAQQKELEDCVVPLEKELKDVPISDTDRDQTYKLAENIDAQLKQMSEDLKEIIEQLNESNKSQELADPVAQIGRILNAHMNSLQWVDRSTAQISSHLDEISKMHEINRRNHENIHGV